MSDDLKINPEQFAWLVEQTKASQRLKYENGLRTPITVKCVVCDVVIEECYGSHKQLAEEYVQHTSFGNGAVGVLSFGYGCQFDTDVFIIGICEHCYEKKRNTGGVLFTRSYMP